MTCAVDPDLELKAAPAPRIEAPGDERAVQFLIEQRWDGSRDFPWIPFVAWVVPEGRGGQGATRREPDGRVIQARCDCDPMYRITRESLAELLRLGLHPGPPVRYVCGCYGSLVE